MNERTHFDGGLLRARRESRGMTVEDVYRKLRIPPHVIRALEGSRLEELPETTYATGFLRTYCEFLEVDPAPFADGLARLHRPPNAGFLRRARSIEIRKRTWMHEALAWAAVSAMFVLGWLTYALVLQPDAKSTTDAVQASMIDPPAREVTH